MVTKTQLLLNKFISECYPIRYHMAVVSNHSEEMIMRKMKSGKYTVVVLTGFDGMHFKDADGVNRYKFAVGIFENGSILTS